MIILNDKRKVRTMSRIIDKIAFAVAAWDANTTCSCITYQEELPEAVKKLGKICSEEKCKDDE